MRFDGRVGDECDEGLKQLLLAQLVEVYFFFLQLQQSFVALDLERHAGSLKTSLCAVCTEPCVKCGDNLVRPLPDFLGDNLRSPRLTLATLTAAGTTDASLLNHLESTDLWIRMIGLVVRLANRDDNLPVTLDDDIEVLPFNADCLYLCGHCPAGYPMSL